MAITKAQEQAQEAREQRAKQAAERKRLSQEKKELDSLIKKGVSFEVKDTIIETTGQWPFRKQVSKEITRKYTIQEPTLATLDRMSAEWIDMAVDDNEIVTDDVMKRARTLAAGHAVRCARVLAIAVLGEDRLVPVAHKGGTEWVEDKREVDKLTALFARTIKPSSLYKLTVMLNTMCNLGDFLNSIRFMSAERTTAPILIEEGR